MRRSLKTLAYGAIAYGLLCGVLYVGQTRLIFFPKATLEATPTTVELDYEDVWLSIDDEQVHGWWIPSGQPTAPVVLYLHGNASNIGDLVNRARNYHRLGIAVLLIDYRGYGQSTGSFPNEAQVYADADAAWRYLTVTRGIPADDIVLHGQSLGGAIATELATRYPEAAGLIIESAPTSMRAVIRHHIPVQLIPLEAMLTQEFDTLTKVRSLQMPVLIIHGTDDQTVPVQMSQQLYQAAPEPKTLQLIPQADHNTVSQTAPTLYYQSIHRFVHLWFAEHH
jgi:alpha-beta hydrolase superfamily lysophospholipase